MFVGRGGSGGGGGGGGLNVFCDCVELGDWVIAPKF